MKSAKRILPAKRNAAHKGTIELSFIVNPSEKEYTGQAMVTFSYDDGFMNNYTLALPLHEEYQIPLSLNIIASKVDVTSGGVMRRNEIIDAYRRGAEIASHSFYHKDEFPTQTDEELHFECGESLRILSEIVPEVDTIAIPFSQYDDRVKSICKQYYKGVRVYGNKQNDMPPHDRYWINCRVAVGNQTTFEHIKNAIDEAVNLNKWCIIMLHGINPNANDLNTYEITPELLEQALQYVNSFSKDVLLPVNTRDGLKFTLGEDY